MHMLIMVMVTDIDIIIVKDVIGIVITAKDITLTEFIIAAIKAILNRLLPIIILVIHSCLSHLIFISIKKEKPPTTPVVTGGPT
jgi:hypothetical protein